MDRPASAVDILGLTKYYPGDVGRVTALAGINLSIPTRGVFSILGPNGAGKSTLMRILTGMVRPSGGSVEVMGMHLSKAMYHIGALIEAPSFFPYLTGRETIEMLSRYHRSAALSPAILLARTGLSEAADKYVDTYSLGMKQRLAIAATLVGDPSVVILDEPTNGLDPDGIRDIGQLLRDLSDIDGRTVIFSSHILSEVRRCCDALAILSNGIVVAQGPISTFGSSTENLRIEAAPMEQLLALLGDRAMRNGDAAVIALPRNEAPSLIASAVAAGVQIFEARWVQNDFEDAYFALTKESTSV